MNLTKEQKQTLKKAKEGKEVDAHDFSEGFFSAFPKMLDLRVKGLLDYEGQGVFSINEKGEEVLEDGASDES